MFQGYLRRGGVEIINVARTMAYLKAGVAPPGVSFDAPMPYDGLDIALGDGPYRSPVLDQAPWFDPANPETADFAGILPLGITGLRDTTRTVTVSDRTGDGGTPSAARRGPKTIAVSALLVGRDAAAADAGYQWLSTVLHRSCEPDADCEGTQLDGFTVCPTPDDLEDVEGALVDTVVARDGSWPAYGGTWDYTTGVFMPPAVDPVPDPEAPVDGGTAGGGDLLDGGDTDGAGTGTADGGDPDGSTPPVVDGDDVALLDGGTPESDGGGGADGGAAGSTTTGTGSAVTTAAWLTLPHLLGCIARVEVIWHVSPLASDPDSTVAVRLGAVDSTGGVLEEGPLVEVTPGSTLTWSREFLPWEEWRPAIFVSSPGLLVTASAAVRTSPLLTVEDCVRPYRRSFAQITCVDGPHVVAEFDDDSGGPSLLQVEWTDVAADPYRYGEPTNLVTGLPVTSNGAPTAETIHVGHTYVGAVTAAATSCPAPGEPITCAVDPTYPGFVPPPAAPVIADPGAVAPTGYTRQRISIEDQLVPDTGAAALRFTFVNDATTKRGVRVRLYHLPEGGGVPAECAFEDEFWINYVPASAVLVVDGITSTVTVECPDSSTATARRVMRGPYKGAFTYPTLRCGGAYQITIDTPASTGALTVTLDAATREG